MTWLVNYEQDIITKPTIIESNDYSSISFENIGSDDAYIDGIIPIGVSELPRKFENRPGEIINDNMRISFAGNSANSKILVIKTYYKERK